LIRKASLRVALVTRSLMTGGAQRHIVKLCQTVDPTEVELSVFLLIRDEPTDLVHEVPAHVPVYISPYRRHHPLVLNWLAGQCRRAGIQVIHSFLWTADAFASLAGSRLPGIRLICSERGDRGDANFYTPVKNLYDRLITFRKADRACANSEFGRHLLKGLGCEENKIRVIHNGIELAKLDALPRLNIRKELGWPDTAIILGVVSRLIDYKGLDVIVRGMASLKDRYPVYCVVIGDGPLQAEMKLLCEHLNVEDRIIFAGRKSPAESWIKDFDIAALVPRADTEHCSNSILEYMACGKPVVATSVAGNPELVDNGKTGWLVPKNDVETTVAAIQRLIEAPEQARLMGEHGRARIESRFDMVRVAENFTRLWQEAAV